MSDGLSPWSALAVEWGPIAVWISAVATFLAVIVAALVAVGYLDGLRGPRIQITAFPAHAFPRVNSPVLRGTP